MNLNQQLNSAAAKIAVWTAQNPVAMRLAVFALPVAVAVAAAIITHHPVYACPPSGSGSGGCGGS